MESTIDWIRALSDDPQAAEASLARRAIFEGAVLEAIICSASAEAAAGARARGVLRGLRSLLLDLEDVPTQAKTEVIRELDRVDLGPDPQERQRRQLALLSAPNPYGTTASDLKDQLDADDPLLA